MTAAGFTPVPLEPTRNQIEAAYPVLTALGIQDRRAREIAAEVYRVMLDVAPEARPKNVRHRQAQVWQYVADYRKRYKDAPTLEEIAHHAGIARQDASKIVAALVRKGIFGKIKGKAHRTIKVLRQPEY